MTALISIGLVSACGGASDSELDDDLTGIEDELQSAGQSSAEVLPPTATATPPSNEFAIVGQPERFLLEDRSLVGIGDWVNSGPLDLDPEEIDSGEDRTW